MTEIISAVWSCLDLCFIYFFWSALFQRKVANKQYITSFVIQWVIMLFYLNHGLNQIVKLILSLSLLVIISPFVNSGKWYQHIVASLLAIGVSGIIDTAFLYAASSFIGISVTELVWKKRLYVTIVTAGKLTSILIAWLFSHFRKFQGFQPMQGKWLLLSILFPAASNAMLMMMFHSFRNEPDISGGVVFFCCVLTITNIAVLYLISFMEKSTERLKEHALLNQQMEILTEHIVALEKSYRAQRQSTHDFRNQLQAISDLLSLGRLDAAQDYVQHLQGQQTTRIFCVNSHNPIVDAVLNHKYQTAKELGIDIQIEITDLSCVNITTDMLIVLLTNLLDNAIEACCRIDGDKVLICSLIAEGSLIISIRNTSQPVIIQNNLIPTSKEPAEEHGYGLSRIQNILSQLHSEYAFEYHDGWFTFVAEIPLNGT